MCKKLIYLVLMLTIGSVAQAGLSEWEAAISSSNPLHWYKFDETGSDCIDSGRAGLNGTYDGVSLAQEGFFGAGTAVGFERTGANRVNFENATDMPGPWTVEYIVKTTKPPAGNDSQALHDSDTGSIRLAGWTPLGEAGFTQYRVADYRFTPEGSLIPDDLVIQPDEWMHLVWRNDGNGTQLFFNGQLVGTSSDFIDLPRLRIGARGAGPGDHLMGVLDEAVVFDRALSNADIITHAIVAGLAVPGGLELRATRPAPADGTICTNNWVNLSWTPGDNAALHNVYFSTDLDAVAQRTENALIATTNVPFESVVGLQMGTTYYWCVDELNDTEHDSPWLGNIWSFRYPAEPAVYLLITKERLAEAFEPLVQRRTEQGFPGRLLTVESISASYTGVDDPEKIRNCILDHHARYETEYVALGGDQVIVPVRYCQPNSDGFEMPADLYYADMDGSDWDSNRNGIFGQVGEVDEIELAPEVHLGRIPLRTSEDASAYINKVITYETTPPDGFANSMIVFGDNGFRYGDTRRKYFLHHDPVEDAETRLMEIYYRDIQPYWQALPLHFLWDAYSSWDTNVCGDYELTLDSLIERLNQGYHFVFYYGHGNPTRWGIGGRRLNVEHAAALTNPIPSIVMSFSCSVAHFDSDGVCISEAFLQNPNGGAVVYFGHTRTAKGDQEFYHLFQAMFGEGAKTVGEAMTQVMTTLAPDRVGNPYKHYNFSLQGDPCIQLLGQESGRHLQVFQPKGCEVIERDSDLYVRWNAAGTGFAAGERIKLEYSSDSGDTWHLIPRAQSLRYNSRHFLWRNCPLPAGSRYRIRVVSLSDPSVTDMSGRDFTIGDLGLLTVQSSPVEGIAIDISGDETASCSLSSNFNITILKGTTFNVSAPAVTGDSSEFEFVRWKDKSGNTITTAPDYTFTLTQDKTLVAEYRGL